jgi:GNAT superfamily N-acetyltransferase
MPCWSQNSGAGAGSSAVGSNALTEVTSRSSRNTCPLNSRVQHFAHEVHRNPIFWIKPARRSTGYSKRLLRSRISAAIRRGIGVRETEITSPVYRNMCRHTSYCFWERMDRSRKFFLKDPAGSHEHHSIIVSYHDSIPDGIINRPYSQG